MNVRAAGPWRVLSLALLIASLAPPWPAAADPCDRDVRTPPDTPYAYKLRGDHCEGIYIREVAGNRLSIVSLTEWFEDFTPEDADRKLLIEWTAPRHATIHLRAVATAPRSYYRMDITRRAGDVSFIWTPNLLKELHLTRDRIGVLGWAMQKVGKRERPVYVPLRISQRQAPQRSPKYQVVALPSVELTEVYVSLTALKPDGSAGKRVVEDMELDRGHYAADTPISVLLEPLPTEGIYLMEISGPVRGGGTAAEQIWLYSPGTSEGPVKVPRGR